MAGITSAPLRRICAEYGAAMCTSEMLVASSLVQRNKATLKLAAFHATERVRSAQLYGVRPDDLEEACRFLVQESGVHHIDLNFGCPVKKVTSKGGGSALPLRPRLLARLVRAAVKGTGSEVPLTVKLRVGLCPELKTFMEAGLIAQEEGAAAVTLHARTADQLYAPPADWNAIAQLAHSLAIPVIGNGDVFEGADAVQLLRATRSGGSSSIISSSKHAAQLNAEVGSVASKSGSGAAGVMIGRAALGRPWLFRDAADMLTGKLPSAPPTLGGALQVALRHLVSWAEWEGDAGGASAVLQMRKLVSLYLQGYSSAKGLQSRLLAAQDVRSWEAAIATGGYEPDEPCAESALRAIRLKGGGSVSRKRVSLPAGWLEGRDDDGVPNCLSDEACEG